MSPSIQRAAVLQVLADHGKQAPERYLSLALAVDFGMKLTLTEVRGILAELAEKNYFIGTRREDGIVVWSITGLGCSVLAEIR